MAIKKTTMKKLMMNKKMMMKKMMKMKKNIGVRKRKMKKNKIFKLVVHYILAQEIHRCKYYIIFIVFKKSKIIVINNNKIILDITSNFICLSASKCCNMLSLTYMYYTQIHCKPF